MPLKNSNPISYKISSIRTWLFRARKICSEEVSPYEINNIKADLYNNGYPISLINKYCKEQGNAERVLTVPKKPVYIHLQYKDGFIHNNITPRLKMIYTAKLKVMHKTQRMLWSSVNEKAAVLDTSNCIYELFCICGTKYIGRKERCLSTRMKGY